MIRIVSFGYGHNEPPAAHITCDVRDLFRDPHYDRSLQQLTGRDDRVIDSVMRQDGAVDYAGDIASLAYNQGLRHDFTAAVGCTGGKHRAPVLVDAIARGLEELGFVGDVVVEHRDIDKPVIKRPTELRC